VRDVLGLRELARRVADPANARHENHRHRRDLRQLLRIVSGAARIRWPDRPSDSALRSMHAINASSDMAGSAPPNGPYVAVSVTFGKPGIRENDPRAVAGHRAGE